MSRSTLNKQLAATMATGLLLYFSAGCVDESRPAGIGPDSLPPPDLVVRASPDIKDPVRIALGKKGILWVSDYSQELVLELKVKKTGFEVGNALEMPGRPLGLAWAGDRLIVASGSTRSVDAYKANGAWLYAFNDPSGFTDPKDISADASAGLVFIVDGIQRRVKVFDLSTGAYKYDISQPGTGEFDLQAPTGIVADPIREEILVSDYGDPLEISAPPRVKIYGYDGAEIMTIEGKSGFFGASKFSRPQGLAVNPNGDIFVVEAVAGQIVVLDRDTGDVLKTLGALGSGPNDLWLPLDVVIDADLDVFVTNNRLQRVQQFVAAGEVQ